MLASITALIALLTAVVALPLFAAQFVLLSADTYLDALDSTSALQRLPDAAAAQLYLSLHYQGKEGADAEPGSGGGAPPALRSLTEDQFRTLLRAVLPPEALRPIADGLFRAVLGASSGSQDPVNVSFASLKERLSSGAAVDAYFQIMRAQPPCTDAQLQTLLATASIDLPACRPPESVITQLRPLVETALAGLVGGIPDQREMSQALDPQARSNLASARTTLLLSPLVPAFFLLLTVALGARSRRGLLRWWGAVLAIAGIAVTATAIALPSFFQSRWASIEASTPAYWSPTILGLSHDVVSAIVVALATTLAVLSLIVALIGVTSLVIAARLTRPAATATAPSTEATGRDA